MKKVNKTTNVLTNILIYITILLSNILWIRKVLDSDLYFDLRTAKDLLTYGLDFKDHMSMFNGYTYLYHHWLYDLIIYPIFKLGSYQLVFLFMLLLFFIFSVIVYKYINSKTNNKLISLIFTIILAFFMGNAFTPRVKSINYVLMLVQFILINKLYKTGKIKYAIFSILISIFLVNIQFPLWLLVPIFYLPYIAQLICKFIKDKYNIKLFDKKIEITECANTKVFMITFILILLSCFVSPYGILPYTFPFRIMGEYDNVYKFIGEMMRVNILVRPYIIICYIFFVIMLISKKKVVLSDIFYLLGLGIFGMTVYRNVPFLYTYYTIIIVSTLFNNIKPIKLNKFNIHFNPIIITIIIFEVFFIGSTINAMDFKNYQYGIQDGGEPVELADWIIDNLDYKNLRFYNDFGQGSYLAYRGIPTFIDSRLEVFMKQFNGQEDVMKDTNYMTPKELLDKYKFDYIITFLDSDMYKYMRENNYEELHNEIGFYYIFKNKEA